MKKKRDNIKRMHEALSQPLQHDNVFGMSSEQAMNVIITRLVAELEKDKEPGSYYYAWQSNIAMAFVDAYKKWHADNDFIFYNELMSAINEIANDAAKKFLNNLCIEMKNTDSEKPQE